jgi:hypothetical protein
MPARDEMSQPKSSSMQPIILEYESGWWRGLGYIAAGTFFVYVMATKGFDWGVLCMMVLFLLFGIACIVSSPKRSPGILIDENGIHYLMPENSRTPPDRDIRWVNVAAVRLEKRLNRHYVARYMHWVKVIVLTMNDGAVQEVDTSGLAYYEPEALVEALKRMHGASSKRPEGS